MQPPATVGFREGLERAVEIDPDFALAYAQLAHCRSFLVIQGWAPRPESGVSESARFARMALERDRDDPEVLAIAAQVLGSRRVDPDAAMAPVGKRSRSTPIPPSRSG